MISSTRQQALLRAAQILGGLEPLAARLKLSPASVRAMLAGRIAVPQSLFLQAVDLISMESPADASRQWARADPTDESASPD